MNEERPSYEQREVSINDSLPELPKTQLKMPSKEQYVKKMEDLDRKAAMNKSICQENQALKRQVYDKSKGAGNTGSYKDISGNIDEVKKYRLEKRSLLDSLNELKEKQRDLESQKQDLLRNVPRNYHNEGDV